MLQAKDVAYGILQAQLRAAQAEVQQKKEELEDMDDELRTVKRQLEEGTGADDEIESLKTRLQASETKCLEYVEIIKKKDARIFVIQAGKKDAVKAWLERKNLEDKVFELELFKRKSTYEAESLKEREEKVKNSEEETMKLHEKVVDLHARIKRKNEQIAFLEMQYQHVVIGRALSSTPKQKKVNYFMFTFTGPPIRRYTMESVFERVVVGRFNDTLMYCVMKLFKGRDEDTLIKLIAEYNQIVGREWAITVVPASDDLPLILPEYKYPKNVILEKQQADIAVWPVDYHSWTNQLPKSGKAGR
jgi:hypothetical protein